MNAYVKIWRFETAQFVVTVDAFEDADMDLSWDDSGETRDKIAAGELEHFAVRARCLHKPTGMESSDWLGGCIYALPADFRDHFGIAAKSRADGVRYGSYFADMVRQVVGEMRENVKIAAAVRLRA